MNEEEHRKEVFAWYGAAAYYSQCLEQELIIVLSLANKIKIPSLSFDSIEETLNKKTFGKLIKDLKKHVTLSEDFEEIFLDCLEKRNYLIHSFFYTHETSSHLSSEKGRNKMLDELKDFSGDFKFGNELAIKIREFLMKTLGFSVDDCNKMVEKQLTKRKDISKEKAGRKIRPALNAIFNLVKS